MSKYYKVLIVDDDEDIQELLEYNLEKDGYKVEKANNGKEAIELVKTFSPHLILTQITQ